MINIIEIYRLALAVHNFLKIWSFGVFSSHFANE